MQDDAEPPGSATLGICRRCFAWGCGDHVELAGVQESIDCGLLSTNSCPVRIDIACEAPTVISWPDEGRQRAATRDLEFGAAVVDVVIQCALEEYIATVGNGHHRTLQRLSRKEVTGDALPDAEIAFLWTGGKSRKDAERAPCLRDPQLPLIADWGIGLKLASVTGIRKVPQSRIGLITRRPKED